MPSLRRTLILCTFLSSAMLAVAQDPVDDAALRANLETKGNALANDSKNIPTAELLKGLENRSASFKIPKSFDLCRNSDEIYDKVKKATLIMSSYALCGNCDKHHASPAGGFIISPDGLAVTNHHVLDQKNATGFAAFTSDGKALRVLKVLAADPAADVAVVQLEGSNLPYLPIADKATLGARVWAMSHPAGHF